MIKAITFDLDGVYFINGKENFVKNLVKLGVSEDEARRVFLKSDKMNKEYKRGLIDDNGFWSWAIKEWGLNLSVQEISDLLISGYELNKTIVHYVHKSKLKGYKNCICTNNFPARIEGLKNRFHFIDNFDVKVLSYEVGELKPNPIMFEELIRQSGVKPEEIAYADDSEANVEEAKKLGINAFFYENNEQFISELNKMGAEL
ncbi:MAG: HAD-IA family hydrolase [Patescibacteria group bacterium]|nr:HAD-IA family hydrolase [Patescibacteria group bacterium]